MGGDGAESADGADGGTGGFGGFGGFGGLGPDGGGLSGPDPGGLGGASGFGLGGFSENDLASMFDIGGPAAGFGAPAGVEAVFGEGQADTTSFGEQSGAFTQLMKHPLVKTLMALHPMTRALSLAHGLTTASDPAAFAGKTAASMMGSAVGSAFAGPLGGMAGGMAMSGLAGQGTSANGASTGATSGFGGMSGSDIGGGLAALYAGSRGLRETGGMLGGLQGLYSQNSPYAQQLRQQLERKDAASGRRSQYGPREVELQARLAQMASNQIPAMTQLNQQQQMLRAGMLKNALYFGNKTGLFDRAGRGLSDMFMGTLGGVRPSIGAFSPSQVYNGADFSNTDPGLDLGGLFGG